MRKVSEFAVRVKINGGFEQFHPLWLRERCTEEFYVDVSTLQPKYPLHAESDELLVLAVEESKASL